MAKKDFTNRIEAIYEQIGKFGKFHIFLIVIISFPITISAISIYVTVFNAAEPKIICNYKDANKTEVSTDKICNLWSNLTKYNQQNDKFDYECKFDKKFYDRTIITDWNLFCDRKYLASLTQTFYLIGSVCAIFSGYFGDRFGRKKTITIILALITLTLNLAQFFQLNFLNFSITAKYVIYIISQIIIGTLTYALYISTYVLVMELVSDSYHTIFSNINLSLYVLGEIYILIPSYIIRDWEYVNWIVAGYSLIVFLIVLLLLPESPRWLITQKRHEDAMKVLVKIANMNGKRIDRKLLENDLHAIQDETGGENVTKVSPTTNNEDNGIGEFTIEEKKHQKVNLKLLFKLLFKPLSNFKKFILLSCVWFSLNLLYYGVSLGITSIDYTINPYLMYIFSAIAELAGYALCSINDKIGRKRATIIYFALAGIICLVISFIPRNTNTYDEKKALVDAIIMILLASIGKCLVSAAFNSCYVFTAEYYPTKVRNFAILFISCIGNIGSFISPQVNLSKVLWKSLPYLIFGSFSLMGSTSVYILSKLKKG